MNSETQNTYSQNFLAILYSFLMAIVSTAIIYVLDKFILGHTDFRPLTEFQFYFVLLIVVFGLIAGLLFYREGKEEEEVEEVSEFRTKMAKKKLKKAKKTRAQDR